MRNDNTKNSVRLLGCLLFGKHELGVAYHQHDGVLRKQCTKCGTVVCDKDPRWKVTNGKTYCA